MLWSDYTNAYNPVGMVLIFFYVASNKFRSPTTRQCVIWHIHMKKRPLFCVLSLIICNQFSFHWCCKCIKSLNVYNEVFSLSHLIFHLYQWNSFFLLLWLKETAVLSMKYASTVCKFLLFNFLYVENKEFRILLSSWAGCSRGGDCVT